jgi:radical SAM family uncharacterized protein/radical SAM-linked protein
VFEDFLPLVAKPARYINGEINVVRKDHGAVQTRICLFFPDTYEVGMSHLGLRILYHILNKRGDTVCERVFSPWPDYEARLRSAKRTLSSLETNTPLRKFDILGFTLQYELSCSNVLAGIDLAGIPLRASDRTAEHPVVIAGGPCAVNPEPLSSFIDAFFIGEAEEAVGELAELHQQNRGRNALLEALSKSHGWHVPAFGKHIVRRRIVTDLERAPYPDEPIVPLIRPIHDRVAVEIARGCIRGCRFCQAGIIYRPYRERSSGCIQGLLEKSLRCTGYDEVSLASLSSGDHSEIRPLMRELADRYRESRVSLSLPSLRIGTLTPDMIRAVAGVRKTGFTLAPEAGTERLRCVINKPVSDDDLKETARTVFASGWNVLKLYFMIGLPTETAEDLDGIIMLTQEILSIGRSASKRPVQINVTLSTFVPKPHTPFQWYGQASRAEIKTRQDYLTGRMNRKGIAVKLHDPRASVLEAALARGDAALGCVLEEAMRLGCRFDGWSEQFDFTKWEKAFRACNLDVAAYATRSFGPDDPLPWDYVHSGVTRKFLRDEYERSRAAEITANCRDHCGTCGIGCADGGLPRLGKPPVEQIRKQPAEPGPVAARQDRISGCRIRMQFTKTGRLKYLSHLDLMVLFQRAAARARIPVAFSQGFNPHPRMSFGPALSVGVESECEFLDIETTRYVEPQDAMEALNRTLPSGMAVTQACAVPRTAPSLSGSIGRYRYQVTPPAPYTAGLQELTAVFLARDAVMVEKEGTKKNIRGCIDSIAVSTADGRISVEISLTDKPDIKPRIQDVVEKLFSLDREHAYLFAIVRKEMLARQGDAWLNPMQS